MFKPGTHVYVSASSKMKGAGPRRGSLGFVSEVSVPVSIFDGYILIPVVVDFYRFGFEQSFRSETKVVLVPIPCKRITGIMKEPLHDLEKKLRNPRLEQWRVSAMKSCPTRASAIVILKPESNIDLVISPPEAFRAWVNCVLDSTYFKRGMHNASASHHLLRSGVMSPPMFEKINHMTFIRPARDDVVDKIINSVGSKMALIDAIRFIDAVITRGTAEEPIKQILLCLWEKIPYVTIGTDRFSRATSLLSAVVFTGCFEEIRSSYKPRTSSQTEYALALEQMENFRSGVLGLSH